MSDTYSISGGLNDIPVSDGKHVFLRHLMFTKDLQPKVGEKRQLFSTSSLLDDSEHHRTGWGIGSGNHDRLSTARHAGGFSRFHLEAREQKAPYRTDQPVGSMLAFDGDSVWGVKRPGSNGGNYGVFKKAIDGKSPVGTWNMAVPVRPRAMIKSGDLLLLGVMPTDMPAGNPHLAYDGKLGGSLWVCSSKSARKLAEYPLSAPVVWDGIAAAGRRIYLSTADGQLICMESDE